MTLKLLALLLSWSISPMQMYVFYFLVTNNGVIRRCVNSKMCLTLKDAFMVKSISKCSLFTYILEKCCNSFRSNIRMDSPERKLAPKPDGVHLATNSMGNALKWSDKVGSWVQHRQERLSIYQSSYFLYQKGGKTWIFLITWSRF